MESSRNHFEVSFVRGIAPVEAYAELKQKRRLKKILILMNLKMCFETTKYFLLLYIEEERDYIKDVDKYRCTNE